MKALLCLLPLFLLSACGYRFDGAEPIAVSVPYVIGDQEGQFTDALASAVSHSGYFRYCDGTGDWILKAKIKGSSNDRIGYRYDRNPKSGELRDNVIGTENRRSLTVEVSVINACTGQPVIDSQTIKAYSDYDYVDSNSLQDLSFIDPATGNRVTSIAFSLGQLDSVGQAGEEALHPIYQRLAQKIVDGMIATGNWDAE